MEEKLKLIEEEFQKNSLYIQQLSERNLELRGQYKLLTEMMEDKKDKKKKK